MRYPWLSVLLGVLSYHLLHHLMADKLNTHGASSWLSESVLDPLLLAPPSTSGTIALKPDHENGLIDRLYKVCNPKHSKHVGLTTPPLLILLRCLSSLRRTKTRPRSSTPGLHTTLRRTALFQGHIVVAG